MRSTLYIKHLSSSRTYLQRSQQLKETLQSYLMASVDKLATTQRHFKSQRTKRVRFLSKIGSATINRRSPPKWSRSSACPVVKLSRLSTASIRLTVRLRRLKHRISFLQSCRSRFSKTVLQVPHRLSQLCLIE